MSTVWPSLERFRICATHHIEHVEHVANVYFLYLCTLRSYQAYYALSSYNICTQNTTYVAPLFSVRISVERHLSHGFVYLRVHIFPEVNGMCEIQTALWQVS